MPRLLRPLKSSKIVKCSKKEHCPSNRRESSFKCCAVNINRLKFPKKPTCNSGNGFLDKLTIFRIFIESEKYSNKCCMNRSISSASVNNRLFKDNAIDALYLFLTGSRSKIDVKISPGNQENTIPRRSGSGKNPDLSRFGHGPGLLWDLRATLLVGIIGY
uniref:Uncharacterized protein n=1 Tax=Romanomermis culicivorax TaxID=13658 RepID=A0A915HYH5_ROMCU